MREVKSRRRTTLGKLASVRPNPKELQLSAHVCFTLNVDHQTHPTGSSGVELTSQEAVDLDEKLQVDILAFGGRPMRAPDMVPVEIDTERGKTILAFGFNMLYI